MKPTATSPDKQSTAKELYGRLISNYVLKYKLRLSGAIAFMFLTAGTSAATAFIMKPIIDEVFFDKDPDVIIYTILAVAVIFTLRGFSSFGQSILMNWVGARVVADIQSEMFQKLVHADLAWFHDNPPGDLISRFVVDTNQLKAGATNTVVVLIKDTLTAIFLVASLFYYDWQLATIILVVLPPGAFAISRLGGRSRKAANNVMEYTAIFTSYIQETFQGIRVVKAYGQEKRAIEGGDEVINRWFGFQYKSLRIIATSGPIIETLSGFVIAAVIFYGATNVINGEITPGTFFAFITALMLAYQPIKSIAKITPQLQLVVVSAERVFAMLDIAHKVTDSPSAKKLDFSSGELVFDSVAFRYNEDESVLHDISIKLEPGKRAALVGPSGGGKSTILNLIPRFYDVNAGSITVDGQDVRDVTLASLREKIALVSQDTFLFDDTIRANIAYGNRQATEAQIIAAAKDASVHDFVMDMPNQYDTVVGSQGVRLSGGQKQRIAIARAMLKDAPILLLDEATSALDTDSEQKIQTALVRLMKGRTSLVIAHRLSTILDADEIFVVVSGRIAEQGTHEKLLQKAGVYADLYKKQYNLEHESDLANSDS